MNKIVYLFILIALGCSSNKCLKENSDLSSRFVDIFRADNKLLAKASKDDLQPYNSEIRLKEKIFSKICNYLNGNKKFIYMEEISPTNMSRVGLFYLYEKDEFYYFIVDNDLDITVNTLYVGYDDLKKLASIVKPDFYKEANRLKEYFSKQIVNDAPYLQLAFIDLNKPQTADSLIGFNFGGVTDEELQELNR